MSKAMSPEQMKVLTFIEQWWHINESFPPVGTFSKQFPDFDINESLRHEGFRLALSNRGIHAPAQVNMPGQTIPNALTPEQLAAITVMVNYADTRPRGTKLKELGISTTKWAGWMKNPVFKEYLQGLTAANFQDAMYIANEGLMKAIDRGDTNAVKFYMEITGRYTQDTPALQNVKLVVAKLVEAVQRHVKDPELLRSIGQDFDALLKGEAPPPPAKALEQMI